jgi:hypothetical protein
VWRLFKQLQAVGAWAAVGTKLVFPLQVVNTHTMPMIHQMML